MTHPLFQNLASPETAEDTNCFAFEVTRDFMDFQVIVEIVNVALPDKSVGIFGSTIEIEAYTPYGRSFSLTESEHERAIEEAISYMERQAEISENELMDR